MNFLRLLAIVLLALPQVVAPLVHAHVGVDASPPEIHLPGLEMKSGLDGTVMESFPLGPYEGVVVAAERGVRQHLTYFPPPSPMFLPGSWLVGVMDSQANVWVTISRVLSLKQIHLFAFSRAPPA